MWLQYVPPDLTVKGSYVLSTECPDVFCNKQQSLSYIALTDWFLSTFANSQKAPVSFVMSIRPHVAPQIPLDGFHEILCWRLSLKSFEKNPNLVIIRHKYFT
jgi:hypothetical protein